MKTNASTVSLPPPPLMNLALRAVTEDKRRILCVTCQGYGAAPESLRCLNCTKEEFCSWHICKMCQGKGAVCPRCCGMRFLSSGDPGYMAKGKEYQSGADDSGHRHMATSMGNSGIVRCQMCCEGNQVNPAKEIAAIKAYLAHTDAPEWTARERYANAKAAKEARISFITSYCRQERKRWVFKGHAAFVVVQEEAEAAYQATKADNAKGEQV